MLVDDNKIDNLFHARVIRKCDDTANVIIKNSAEEALEYLKGTDGVFPHIIFLDINMPGMSGWDFIEKFRELKDMQDTLVVVMLGTFENTTPEMQSKVEGLFAGFAPKPLTKESFDEVLTLYSSHR